VLHRANPKDQTGRMQGNPPDWLSLVTGDFQLNNRILVVTGSGDSASQYMNYMNVFFTAQKQGIVIDVCALDQHLSLLQQGCDITGGLYLKVPQLQGLLQYLLVSL
jgi:transcription factor TFB4